MSIEETRKKTQDTAPYFFTKDTMRFFRQTMGGWKVTRMGNRWKISQNMKDSSGRVMGVTIRFFNPDTNELDFT